MVTNGVDGPSSGDALIWSLNGFGWSSSGDALIWSLMGVDGHLVETPYMVTNGAWMVI